MGAEDDDPEGDGEPGGEGKRVPKEKKPKKEKKEKKHNKEKKRDKIPKRHRRRSKGAKDEDAMMVESSRSSSAGAASDGTPLKASLRRD